MCHECDKLKQRILQFQRVLAQPLDALTTERLAAAVVDMEARKSELHLKERDGK
jgi:hypothetical protein